MSFKCTAVTTVESGRCGVGDVLECTRLPSPPRLLLQAAGASTLQHASEGRGNHEAMGKESGICFCKLIEILGVTMQGLLVTAREIVCLNAHQIVHLMTQCCGPRLRLSKRTRLKILRQKSWQLLHRSHECGKCGVISANYSWPIRESLGAETHSWFWWQLKEMVPSPFTPCAQSGGKQMWKSVGSFCLAERWPLLFLLPVTFPVRPQVNSYSFFKCHLPSEAWLSATRESM